MISSAPASLRVAIVGGGVAGSLAALILAKIPGTGTITLLDRDGRFGRGLAYSTPSKWHRINVPAYKMGGIGTDDQSGFVDWLTANGHLTDRAYSTSFVPRWLYGDYLRTQLEPLVSAGRLTMRQELAESIDQNDNVYRILTATGKTIEADLVFVCIGNHPPSPFFRVDPSPRSVNNVWALGALDSIAPEDRVLILGTGATAVDAVIDLVHRGVTAPITMVSRRGLLPLIDVETVADPDPVEHWPVHTARGLFHSLREEIRRKATDGIPWQTAIDTFRLHVLDFWKDFSEVERGRFSRHLRSIWMVHRHRLAPDVAQQLAEMRRDKRLNVVAGRLISAVATSRGHDVVLHARGGGAIRLSTDWILNCTGPEERYDQIDNPLVRSLLATGRARPGPNGLGLDVDPDCQLRDGSGNAQPGLFAIGPATRGAFWEVTAASSIRQQLLGVATSFNETMTAGPKG